MNTNVIIGIIYLIVFGVWAATIYIRCRYCHTPRFEQMKLIRVKEYQTFGRAVYAFWTVDGIGTVFEFLLVPILLWRIA